MPILASADLTQHTILAEHAGEIRVLGKRAVTDVIEIGRRLTECKRICGHGNWLPWFDREFGWTEQTALNFMRLAALNKSKTVLDLDVPLKALYLLAAPSTPEEAGDEIIERAETGETVSTEIITTAIANRRQPPVTAVVKNAWISSAVWKIERQISKLPPPAEAAANFPACHRHMMNVQKSAP